MDGLHMRVQFLPESKLRFAKLALISPGQDSIEQAHQLRVFHVVAFPVNVGCPSLGVKRVCYDLTTAVMASLWKPCFLVDPPLRYYGLDLGDGDAHGSSVVHKCCSHRGGTLKSEDPDCVKVSEPEVEIHHGILARDSFGQGVIRVQFASEEAVVVLDKDASDVERGEADVPDGYRHGSAYVVYADRLNGNRAQNA